MASHDEYDLDPTGMNLDSSHVMTLEFNGYQVTVNVSYLIGRIKFLRTPELIQFIKNAIIPKKYHRAYKLLLEKDELVEYDLSNIIFKFHTDNHYYDSKLINEFRMKYQHASILKQLRSIQYDRDRCKYMNMTNMSFDKDDLDFLQAELLYFKTHYPYSNLTILKELISSLQPVKIEHPEDEDEDFETYISQDLTFLTLYESEFNPVQ